MLKNRVGGGTSLLSKNRSALFGIAALLILVGHSQDFLHSIFPDRLIDIIGYGGIGVTMFAFLSGIGLWYSIDKSEDILQFYKNRIHRVIVPYLIISIVFNAYLDLFVQRDIVSFLSDVTCISFWIRGRGAWYVAWAIVIYAVYPLYAKLTHKRGYISGIVALLLIVYILIIRIPIRFQSVAGATVAFLIGDMLAVHVKNNKPGCLKMVACLIIVAPLYMLGIIRGRAFYVSIFAAVGISLCAIFAYVLEVLPGKVCDNLSRLGVVSLECYLFNIYLISVARHLLDNHIGAPVGLIAYVFVLVLGIGLSLAIGKIKIMPRK